MNPVLAEIIQYRFSWQILLLLVFLLLVAVTMFTLILRRATTQRHRIALHDWTRAQRMQVVPLPALLPAPLDRLIGLSAHVEILVSGKKVKLVRFVSASIQGTLAWHGMIHQIESDWPATALRPVGAARSLLDHFQLEAHLSLSNERFLIKGESILAAKALADSSERALLPPDLGLLLLGRSLLIDFSSRPFDPIEFMRLLELSEQLIAHLPGRNS